MKMPTEIISPEDRIRALPCWNGSIEIAPLAGGLTNLNFRVTCGTRNFVARIASDVPELHVYRWHEVQASEAACDAGVAPAVRYSGGGILVTDFIEGKTLDEADIRSDAYLTRIAPFLRDMHAQIPHHWGGPTLSIWPFQVSRSFARYLTDRPCRHADRWNGLMSACDALESLVGPSDFAITHNDLLPSNFIDDGDRLWLIDWEYAGSSTPLFDLANLAINSDLSDAQCATLAEGYGLEADAGLMTRFAAFKAASSLREAGWSMIQEIISPLDVDYVGYTDMALARFDDTCASLGISS